MVATSQGLATRAGLRTLERGGNAVDAALAAAAVQCVVEPMSTGVGGDLFAIVYRDGKVAAVDAAGPAPARPTRREPVAEFGPESVDVPGAVAGWGELASRFGRLGLDNCLRDAIDVAAGGFPVGHHAARQWGEATQPPAEWGAPPSIGTSVRLPDLGRTLRTIAEEGPRALYRGPIAAAIAAASWLSEEDLVDYAPSWVTPLQAEFQGLSVLELPPPTQGVAALEALGLIDLLGTDLSSQIRAVQLSLEDALSYVRDGADVAGLLTPEHLSLRSRAGSTAVTEPGGGTVYICAVDEDRMAVSLIQSLSQAFGSGVLVSGTGIVLNGRAASFSVGGSVTPGRRPYHTLIPGLLLDPDGRLVGPFGVMGGFIQAQAHAQFVVAAIEEGLDPQAALDRSRFRVDGHTVHLEPGLWPHAEELQLEGLTPVLSEDITFFGGGQAIFVRGDALVGGSDARKDGYAAAT